MTTRRLRGRARRKGVSGRLGSEGLPPAVIAAFQVLANEQRGEAESAMEAAQGALGGGVLSFAIEHTGDLVHRMSQNLDWDPSAGYHYVENKVAKVLRTLREGYGFRREHVENMRNNARFRGEPLADYLARARQALRRYAAAHAQLPVYNRPQFLARRASVALGEERFEDAERALGELEKILADYDVWTLAATACRLDAAGGPVPFEGRAGVVRYQRRE